MSKIKKGKGFIWEIEDEQKLKEYYLIKTKEELLDMFEGRTWKAIRNKANKFELKRMNDYKKINKNELYKIEDGIKYKKCKACERYLPLDLKYFPQDSSCDDGHRGVCKECKGENFAITNHIKWTNNEIEILIKEYSTATLTELSKIYFPNRRREYIDYKAIELNIYKTKETMGRIYIERFTIESNLKISKSKKLNGVFKGKANPMFGSHRIGILNPNWKGGLSSEKERIMRTEEYKNWRKSVFERDNYICRYCGKMTHDIEAHHLDNFADFKDKRFNVMNGLTLCKSCHNPNQKGSFHNIYGTLHNTKKQFEEYIKYRKIIDKEVS